MDRRPHDYAAASAMAYAQQQRQAPNIQQQQQQQQQQQYGFHPQHQHQHQQYPPPPFMPLQQFPYPHPMQQQPQLHPHPQMYTIQQQPPAFPSHLPPHIPPPHFPGSYDSAPPPPPAAAPSDPELHKRIDKLIEYATKNGPEFEAMIREKQKDNPEYNFLFGGEGHGYYRYKHWLSTHPLNSPYSPALPIMHHSSNPMMIPSSLHGPPPGPLGTLGGQIHHPPFPPFYDQHHQHPHPFLGQGHPEYDQSTNTFKGLSGPLPSDVAAELNNVLTNLNGTKESIKSAKIWFMQRSPFGPALAEALRDRMINIDDSERQLHIVYLANDILFDSLQRRMNPVDLDNVALAFRPFLGSMLGRIYHNVRNKEENQSRLQKILQFWASKEVYDQDTISSFETEMKHGLPANAFPGPPREATDPVLAGIAQQTGNQIQSKWQADILPQDHPDKQLAPAVANAQFPNPSIGEKLAPYPLFPPGLIPGMVRKMQIGSGVPYSPLSPLDIPTIIPPSDVSPSHILERVSKFFNEIGEVNPSEGPMKSNSRDEDDDMEYEYDPVRKGGACIPPPAALQVLDPETGTYADGSVDRKSGGSGRLGLGAAANPNEPTQYDDVYNSYRKQRSTNYHSSMSARAATGSR